MNMSQMIFVTGFARGGTSWLRNCIAFHPDIAKIPVEMVLFREHSSDTRAIEEEIEAALAEYGLDAPYFVNKAPANAPFVGKACRLFPETKFIFIIRDPRDVFVSHKRGNQKWMRGANSTIQGCLEKTERYFKGYVDAKGCPNVLLVKYEDLHQDFHRTMAGVYDFLNVKYDEGLLENCFRKNNFVAATGRQFVEDRDGAARKGVIGDWAEFMENKEVNWLKGNAFWSGFMKEYGYSWEPLTFESILKAMKDAEVNDLSGEDLLVQRLSSDRPNVFLLHDIDFLKTREARQSVLDTARIEARLGLAGLFNFLPLDDARYQRLRPEEVVAFIREIREISPKAEIGLHLNAAERYFPDQMEDADDDHPNMKDAVAYLHRQIDEYAEHGVTFRIATAHGYGRGKKRPNNRDSQVFPVELEKRGIKLFDTSLRRPLDEVAGFVAKYTDVGGPLSIRDMAGGGAPHDPETYRNFPAGGLIRYLSHPGNYDVNRHLELGLRFNCYPAPK